MLALALSLAPQSAAAPEPLDSRWIQGIGTVVLSAPREKSLTIEIRDEAGATSTRRLDLDLLDPKAIVVEAHSASFIAKEGLLVALAVQTGDTTSYHSLLIGRLADQPADARTNAPEPQEGRRDWSLTKPIFTSTGERYRILDVHNPGGDGIEMTFRRGYAKALGRDGKPQIDEKVYVNVCAGGEDPTVFGALLDVSATRQAR
jgi:hypothetical protein